MTATAIVLLVVISLLPIGPAIVREIIMRRTESDDDPRPVIDSVTVVIFAVLAAVTACFALAGGAAHGVGSVVAACAAALAATTGGGFVVRRVLAAGGVISPAPESGETTPVPHGTDDPERAVVGPLRGGRVIGYLERAAVAIVLLVGWPEGMAVILAVKSLARYPELRAPHASEQFIMGTFASVLWAAGMSGLGYLILH